MITIKKFSAEWCSPCKSYDPILQKVVDSRDDVDLKRVDIEEFPDQASKYGVQGVPYTVFEAEDGTVLGGFKGAVTAGKLNQILDGFAKA